MRWLASEKNKRIWQLSFWGSLVSLACASHMDKLPVIVGYLALPVIYERNLFVLKNEQKETLSP